MQNYFDTLDETAKSRYEEKIEHIGKQDPYKITSEKWLHDPQLYPSLSYPDLVNYLIFQPSPFYTLKDFQNYKSLDAYDRFVCGWVRDVGVYIYDVGMSHTCVIRARVMHSQRLSDSSLHPWIIFDKDGKVLSAHCNCKAGLGESCSHVASTLFYVEASVRLRESSTVTQKPAYWMLPASRTSVDYAPLRNIDFTSSKTLKKQLDQQINEVTLKETPARTKKPVSQATPSELDAFFNAIKEDKPACLSVYKKYNQGYIPKGLEPKYPMMLTQIYSDDFQSASKVDILHHCKLLFNEIKVTEEEVVNVELATKDQAGSKLWHRFRTGRVTASRMKAVCSTSCDKPSMSLLRSICYPVEANFSTAATRWGCQHEQTARNSYFDKTSTAHHNVKISSSGLFLSSTYPYLGASPDGLVECDCCGQGCIEIKCPYCMKDENVRDGKNSCLEKVDGILQLKKNHPYFFQVQSQLHVCNLEYCDFVVWTNEDLFIQRIVPCSELWESMVEKSTLFFTSVILPELIGKLFSRKDSTLKDSTNKMDQTKKSVPKQVRKNKVSKKLSEPTVQSTRFNVKNDEATTSALFNDPSTSTTLDTSDDDPTLYCICGGSTEDSRLIACDSEDCPHKPFEWFHFSCMKLRKAPAGEWFCVDCREKEAVKNVKRSRNKSR